jgi:hypothetical protein
MELCCGVLFYTRYPYTYPALPFSRTPQLFFFLVFVGAQNNTLLTWVCDCCALVATAFKQRRGSHFVHFFPSSSGGTMDNEKTGIFIGWVTTRIRPVDSMMLSKQIEYCPQEIGEYNSSLPAIPHDELPQALATVLVRGALLQSTPKAPNFFLFVFLPSLPSYTRCPYLIDTAPL